MLKIRGIETSARDVTSARITAKIQFGEYDYQTFDLELSPERVSVIMDAVRAMVAEQLGMVELDKPEPEIAVEEAPYVFDMPVAPPMAPLMEGDVETAPPSFAVEPRADDGTVTF